MSNIDWKKYDRQISYIIWALYVILLCFVSYHHEPWHDEGQAWLIARDDSIWQMITVTLHWEGHPPLWHLLLMPFAKMGVPFELGLKSVNIACCSLAMWLLLIKSPLPWYFRYFLPFNYFFFYQYGVISRCYSLLMAGMMLCAYYYPSRREKPYHLALSLALVAGTMAYGMMLACGIALAWLIEILRRDYRQAGGIVELYKQSTESRGLLLLFVISLFFVYCMSPRSDTAFAADGAKTGFWENLLYMLSVSPGILFFSNELKDGATVNAAEFFFANLKNAYGMIEITGWFGVLIFLQTIIGYSYGLIIQGAFLYGAFITRKMLLYILPLLCYSILAGVVHWGLYHAGTLLCLLVFFLWQVCADTNGFKLLKESFIKQFTFHKETKLIFIGLGLSLLVAWGNNFYWTGTASVNDYYYDYDPSRKIALFIKEMNLDNRATIWTEWHYLNMGGKNSPVEGGFNVNAYFDRNIFQNMNEGATRPTYHRYAILNKKAFEERLKEQGEPDIIIVEAPIHKIFSKPHKYIPIFKFKAFRIWKDSKLKIDSYIFLREDLQVKFPDLREESVTEEESKRNILLILKKYGVEGILQQEEQEKKWNEKRIKLREKLRESNERRDSI